MSTGSLQRMQPRPGNLTLVRRFSLAQMGDVLRKLGMACDTAKAKDLHTRHGDTFQKLLHDQNAPLQLTDDGAGGIGFERRAQAPGATTEAALPEGFAALARELADMAPAQSLGLLEAAMTCAAKEDVLAELARLHAQASLACKPAQSTTAVAVTTTTETTTTTMPPPTLSVQAQTAQDVNLTGTQRLALAIDGGHLGEVEQLLAGGRYLLNEALEGGHTALQRAALKGQIDIVRHLLKQDGIQPDLADDAGVTPLHHALMGRHEAVARILVARNADIHARTKAGATPFYIAILANLLDMAKLLREKGADIEATTSEWSPLRLACKGRPPETVQWLLEQGASVVQRGPHGFNVLHVAALNTAHPGVLDVLIARLPEGEFQTLVNQPDAWGTKAVGRAAECGQSEAFINKLQPTQVAPLLQPVPTNYKRCWVVSGTGLDVRYIRKIVDMGTRGGIQMQAYGNGKVDLCWKDFKALKIQGGDMVTLNCHTYWSEALKMQMLVFGLNEYVPLIDVVVHLRSKGVLRLLVTGCGVARAMSRLKNRLQLDPGTARTADQDGEYKGLNITVVGIDGATLIPLNQIAVALWIQDAVAKILHGVEGRALQQRGVQPMRALVVDVTQKALVIQERAALTVDHLTDLDPDQAAQIKSQLLLMHVSENHLAEVQALVDVHKVDPHGKDEKGYTPLLTACEQGHVELVRFFLEHTGADIEDRLGEGATPLWVASRFNRPRVVELLLQKGAKVDATDDKGFTPLCAASRQGHLEVVKSLLKAGASRDVVVSGRTVVEAALEMGHHGVARLLMRW